MVLYKVNHLWGNTFQIFQERSGSLYLVDVVGAGEVIGRILHYRAISTNKGESNH